MAKGKYNIYFDRNSGIYTKLMNYIFILIHLFSDRILIIYLNEKANNTNK